MPGVVVSKPELWIRESKNGQFADGNNIVE
jgi:hypothetical protein